MLLCIQFERGCWLEDRGKGGGTGPMGGPTWGTAESASPWAHPSLSCCCWNFLCACADLPAEGTRTVTFTARDCFPLRSLRLVMEAPSTWWNPLDGKAAPTGKEGAGQLHTPAATPKAQTWVPASEPCARGMGLACGIPVLTGAPGGCGVAGGGGLVPATLPCLLSATKTLLPPRLDSPPVPSPVLV